MNKYELVYIIDPAVEEEARKGLVERFNALVADNGGTVDKVEEWGKRRLAYAIDYKTEGYYVLVNFSSEATLPQEMERNLKNNESIIRYQIVRILERKVGIKPRAPRVMPAPAQTAEEAPAAEATAATDAK